MVCNLVETKRPPGILAILDDTCKTVHSAAASDVDDKFVGKLNSFQGSHKHYKRAKGGFTIVHYAGDVTYTALGFCAANKDTLFADMRMCLKQSTSKLLPLLYPEEVDLDDRRVSPLSSTAALTSIATIAALPELCALPHTGAACH